MKALKVKTIIAAITMMVLGITTTNAQKNPHNVGVVGKGPHGGTIQEAEPNHAEILVKDNKVYIYFLDGDAKPISNKGITGTAVLQFKNATTAVVNLLAIGSEGFVLDDPKAATFSNCIVSAKINGKSVSAKFKNYSIAKPAAASTHQH